MAIFGFNTDVKVGKLVFHVQTEDRGVNHPVLDTTIYHKGRVLAKRAVSYKDFLASPDFNESELHSMLEQQHKQLLHELRSGQLTEMASVLTETTPGGISVKLLNPGTFLKGTTASLELAVAHRKGGTPVASAAVTVLVHTGGPQPHKFETQTDFEGKALLQFAMPRLGPGGADVVIQASSGDSRDEIKYSMRPRSKAKA